MQTTTTRPFSTLLNAAIDDTGLVKEAIAIEAGMHVATLYRVLGGGPVSKPKVRSIVAAVNKLAMFAAINESEALEAAGFASDHRSIDPNTIAEIIDNLAYLPKGVQEDVLSQVQGLRRKYER